VVEGPGPLKPQQPVFFLKTSGAKSGKARRKIFRDNPTAALEDEESVFD